MRWKLNLTADAALLVTNVIWGTTFVIVKDLLNYLPPIAYLMFRMSLAALILILIFFKNIRRLSWREVKIGILLGGFLGAGYVGQAIGQLYTTPTKSAFITGLTTPLVPLVSFIFLRLRPSVENLLGVVLASIGGVLMLAPNEGAALNRGDVITLGCAILLAFHISLACHFAKQCSAEYLTLLQITAMAILITLFWSLIQIPIGTPLIDPIDAVIAIESKPFTWNLRVVIELIYLALVGTVVTYFLWTWGQARRPPSHVAIMFSLHPIFAAIFALLTNGTEEWLGIRGTIGAIVILISVLLTQINFKNEYPTSTASVYPENR